MDVPRVGVETVADGAEREQRSDGASLTIISSESSSPSYPVMQPHFSKYTRV
jgi:hypothetical protein